MEVDDPASNSWQHMTWDVCFLSVLWKTTAFLSCGGLFNHWRELAPLCSDDLLTSRGAKSYYERDYCVFAQGQIKKKKSNNRQHQVNKRQICHIGTCPCLDLAWQTTHLSTGWEGFVFIMSLFLHGKRPSSHSRLLHCTCKPTICVDRTQTHLKSFVKMILIFSISFLSNLFFSSCSVALWDPCNTVI